MEDRVFHKAVVRQCNPSNLLRRFDTKNFVKINQDLLNFIDNFQAGRSGRVSAITDPANQPSSSKPLWDDNKASRVKLSDNSSRASCGYSLRSSRRVTGKFKADSEYDDDDSDKLVIKEEVMDTDELDSDHPPRSSLIVTRQKRKATSRGDSLDVSEKRGSGSVYTPSERMESHERSLHPDSIRDVDSTSPPLLENFEKPTMSDFDGKKARYGWFVQNMNNLPVITKDHPNYFLEDPDPETSVCYNERKQWVRKYSMCIGQRVLCRWM